jgi:four helix bundle protein
MGSASELEYHLVLAHDLALLGEPEYRSLEGQVVEVKRMLSAFISKLKAMALTDN